MSEPIKVLFICTGNCCRSQMAEALLRNAGGDRFRAFSAGSKPAGFIHPLAIETLRRMGISAEGQYSKSWDEYTDQHMEVIITVCDSAAGFCPQWPGRPATAHWGLPDPSFAPGTEEDRLDLAMMVARRAQRWIEQMVKLPLEEMEPQERQSAIHKIAKG
jgi:arsenate reductase (thioredoxin)